ncbi:MAG: hypothetical protein HY551_05815 [Elusimicrobia bacterium]|nr:hypothetical protein [Elusimicrobiota bacterium]
MILVEGYTEYRTRQALFEILADGRGERNGFAASELKNFSRRYGSKNLSGMGTRLRADFEKAPYHPYVQFVKELIIQMGGLQPVEDFVSRGNISGISQAIGMKNLLRIAKWAGIYGRYAGFESDLESTSLSEEAQAAHWIRLPEWMGTQARNVVSGRRAWTDPQLTEWNKDISLILGDIRNQAVSMTPTQRSAFAQELRSRSAGYDWGYPETRRKFRRDLAEIAAGVANHPFGLWRQVRARYRPILTTFHNRMQLIVSLAATPFWMSVLNLHIDPPAHYAFIYAATFLSWTLPVSFLSVEATLLVNRLWNHSQLLRIYD